MTRHLVVSSDCHAGLQPERYREYLDPQYRERFDTELALQIAQREEMARLFLVDEFNESWQRDNSELLAGAWDHDKRIEVLDTDGAVVPGLWAAGRSASGIPAQGYNSGLSLADCTFSGRMAGVSVAGAGD